MKRAIKSRETLALAYELGSRSEAELRLMQAGSIRATADGKYELFSRESVNGSGEIAPAGDFFKLDGGGYPYPIRRERFLASHLRVAEDLYEQRSDPLWAWTVEDGMCPEIEYLMTHKGLTICGADAERYFSAPLWGTLESAARDAVIVFYEIHRNADGGIVDAVFNFVERSEFDRTYVWLE